MNRRSIIAFVMGLQLLLCACSSHCRVDGWYPLADYPDNSIVGGSLITLKDFDRAEIVRNALFTNNDTINQLSIQGRVKPRKRKQWADATERMIGKRLGFVYKDSLIMAVQINNRIESGNFEIISSDSALLQKIYDSYLKHK